MLDNDEVKFIQSQITQLYEAAKQINLKEFIQTTHYWASPQALLTHGNLNVPEMTERWIAIARALELFTNVFEGKAKFSEDKDEPV